MVEVSLTASVRAMELITILNRCPRFRGFVYQQAHFSADKKSIEVAVRPRKGSAAVCSRRRRETRFSGGTERRAFIHPVQPRVEVAQMRLSPSCPCGWSAAGVRFERNVPRPRALQ